MNLTIIDLLSTIKIIIIIIKDKKEKCIMALAYRRLEVVELRVMSKEIYHMCYLVKNPNSRTMAKYFNKSR